jgi:hypothetical protein
MGTQNPEKWGPTYHAGRGRAETGRGAPMVRARWGSRKPEGRAEGRRRALRVVSATSACGASHWTHQVVGRGNVSFRFPPFLPLHACSLLPRLRVYRSPFPPNSPSFRASPRYARHPVFMRPHLSRLRAPSLSPVDAESPFHPATFACGHPFQSTCC